MFKKSALTFLSLILLLTITACEKKPSNVASRTGTVAIINTGAALEALGWNAEIKKIQVSLGAEFKKMTGPFEKELNELRTLVGKNTPTKEQIIKRNKIVTKLRSLEQQFRQTMQQYTYDTREPYILKIKEETIKQAKLGGYTIVQIYNPQTIMSYDAICDLTEKVINAVKATNKAEAKTQETKTPETSAKTPETKKEETPAKK